MNVLRNPSFFRPSSRPSSPAPALAPSRGDSNQSLARPPNKLSLTNFIRQTPSQSSSQASIHAPLIQDGSYLEMLSLKLSEAVSKALAQPTGPPVVNEQFPGKRLIPQGRGLNLGSLIASELNAVHDNSHLHKAVLRSLQRPFTVLLTNISGQLLPTLSSPSFNAVPNVNNQFSFPNGIQLYALSIARFSEELLQVFDELGLGTDADVRGDGLKSIRDGLVSVINRVVNPLIAGIRGILIPLIEALENPNTLPVTKPPPGARPAIVYHPSIVSLQTLMPVYSKALTACTTSSLSHAALASLLISILWKAMVAFAHRVDIKQSPLLTAESTALGAIKKRRGGSPTVPATPPLTPPPGRFMIKLPPSRPPSPPAIVTHANAATDCKALYDLLMTLPRPSSNHGSTQLAKEAVDEAFEGLHSLPALLAATVELDVSESPDVVADKLIQLTEDIPSLIALPIILRAFGGPGTSSVPAILGLPEEGYRKGCLSGFSRAEECTLAVGQRVLDALQTDSESNKFVIRWLETEMADTEDPIS